MLVCYRSDGLSISLILTFTAVWNALSSSHVLKADGCQLLLLLKKSLFPPFLLSSSHGFHTHTCLPLSRMLCIRIYIDILYLSINQLGLIYGQQASVVNLRKRAWIDRVPSVTSCLSDLSRDNMEIINGPL